MPAAMNPNVNGSIMNSVSGITHSTTSLNSSHVNNVSANSLKPDAISTATTKYIQLQSVRPSHVNSTMLTSSPVPTATMLTPRAPNTTVSSPATSQRLRAPITPGINIPPGMVLTRTSNGQLVLVNGNQIQTNNQPQAAGSTQSVVTAASRVITTLAASTSSISVTTVGRPVSVVSSVATVANTVQARAIPVNSSSISLSEVGTAANTVQTRTIPVNSSPVSLTDDDMVNVNKCRNFLTTLIKLASSGGQLQETVRNVKALVQNLIDDKIRPEEFTKRLQVELKSAPQPYLIPFLERSLPLLRLTMMQQSHGGQVPVTVAQAAIRASSLGADSVKSPGSPRPKISARVARPAGKNFRNNVPDIRLPRITSSESSLKHPSLQTPPPDQPQISFQPPPHPSSVSGTRITSLTTVRHPYAGTPSRGNQRWNAASGGGGSYKDDDDINDVASMAGVNLLEESNRILATNSELVGTQTRSCKDDTVLNAAALQKRMSEIASRNPHIQHIHADAVKFLSCAAEARLKDVLEKVSVVVCHRTLNFKEDEHYEACGDVKTQLKFLQELDQIEKKKHDEAERDILMRAMKSRSKNDNPEHLRLKERAKEMQQQEMEKLQIRNADETARNAIGPRKKKSRLDLPSSAGLTETRAGSTPARGTLRSRTKRVNLRDLMFVLEHDKATCKSTPLYKSYLK